MATEEGQKDEKCVTTTVSTASVRVSINAPPAGVVGVPVNYEIVVTNPSPVMLPKVDLNVSFDEGLEHEQKSHSLRTSVENVAPQDVRKLNLILTPKQVGRFRTKVEAVAGSVSDQATTIASLNERLTTLMADEATGTAHAGDPITISSRQCLRDDVPVALAAQSDELPRYLSEACRVPLGIYQGLRFRQP